MIDDDELCDDGNASAADGCEIDCTPTIAELVAGARSTCVRTHAGALRCWGSSSYSQLGYGNNDNVGDDETPADVGDVDVGQAVAQVVLGEGHICALLDDGAVRCWGRNNQGQCGYGHDDFLTDVIPSSLGTVDLGGTAVALTAGSNHTCALLDDGTVRCWGRNVTAQLGLGHTENIGDDETPASQPAVDVGGDVVQIAGAGYHTCAALEGGAVRCWGLGTFGRLGYGNTEMIGDDELPSAAGDIDLGIDAVQVGGGDFHTCVRGDMSEVRCFGHGLDGALGYGSFQDVGDDEVPADVGDSIIGTGVDLLASGAAHNCVVTDLATVRCWGRDGLHQLGLPGGEEDIGDNEPPSAAAEVDVGGNVVQLSLGTYHSCALLEHGAVRCWGDGTQGALGYGNALVIGDDETPAEAGDVPVF
jgi:alpha-tubulin suppressor-like RCC1 family protein